MIKRLFCFLLIFFFLISNSFAKENFILNPILDIEYGIYLEYNFLSTYNIIFYCSVVLISILFGLIPAYRGYKKSLNSGI